MEPSFHAPRGGASQAKGLSQLVSYCNFFKNIFVLIAVSILAIFYSGVSAFSEMLNCVASREAFAQPWSVMY